MTDGVVDVRQEKKPPLNARFVQFLEEMSPAVPLIGSLMWGILLVLLSFALRLSMFQVGTKAFGWIAELNWSSTFGFFIPFSLFFSCSAFTAIPQVITTLADGQMIRNSKGELEDAASLLVSWRRRAGRTVTIATFVAAMGFAISWIMMGLFCLGPIIFHTHQGGTPSWQVATLFGAPGATRVGVAVFAFLAYTSQGAAIACFCYYILIIFTFANWIHDYTKFRTDSALYPDIAERDLRFGFEKFGPVIENILLASLAYFFQFFMTRLFYIYLDDQKATSMLDIITRDIGRGCIHDLGSLFTTLDPSLFDFGSSLHFQNTMMTFGMLIVVISAIIVPTVIVRNAASRSKVRLEEAIQRDSTIAQRWYGLTSADALERLDKMMLWPIRYAKPMELLLLIFLATACFFAYKLFLLLVGFIVYRAIRQFNQSFSDPKPVLPREG